MKYIKPRVKLYKNYKINLYLKNNIKKKLILKNFLSNKVHSYFFFQLKEKQKLKIIYGVLDKQFKNYYIKSKARKINIIILLELRLDNIIYRSGITSTRKTARQIINHKFIKINNKIITIPSYEVKIGDLISFNKNYKIQSHLNECDWIFFNYKILKGYLKRYPFRSEVFTNINENLIIDYYKK